MTPDQLPAGLPMDDKIEAWVQQAMQLADAFPPAITRWRYAEPTPEPPKG